MILLLDLEFFRNRDFVILRSCGQLRSVAHVMAVSCSVIILILKSGNMFNGERTKFGTRFYDYGNVVSRKKVEKMKEIYKRNHYREVRRNFKKWKEDEGKVQDLFGQKEELQKERKEKVRTVKMKDEQQGQQKDQQAE